MSNQDDILQCIDVALEKYYQRNGFHNYRVDDGDSKFIQFLKNEQLNDPELPVEEELGYHCDPQDCAYTWMYNNSNCTFPLPQNIYVPAQHMEQYIFYILQYCYKYNKPPTNQYIADCILSKINRTITQNTLSAGNICMTVKPTHNIHKSNGTPTSVPAAFSQISIFEGVSYQSVPCISRNYSKITMKNENIFVGEEIIKKMISIIDESFENESVLYYYMNVSAILQMNDNELNAFTVSCKNDKQQFFSVINYNFHVKGTATDLYGIIVPNDNDEKEGSKSSWQLQECMTAKQIFLKYQVPCHELPQSSQKNVQFQRELVRKLVIKESLIDDTDWVQVPQIKGLGYQTNIIALDRDKWIQECKKSFENTQYPLIPIVGFNHTNHWVEWIKIVEIYVESEHKNLFFGVSLKYNEYDNQWKVQSIYLNKDDICRKHRLIGLIDSMYTIQLKNFITGAQINFK